MGGSSMWRLGAARSELLSMISERLRHVFESTGLWKVAAPDTLQLTKIGCAQKLANHWDRWAAERRVSLCAPRLNPHAHSCPCGHCCAPLIPDSPAAHRRDRWLEGIASIAWSELPCEQDLRGDAWTLNMERGSKKDLRSIQITMQPGSAYILMGRAQGVTKVCERRCVGHNRCNCCWTHGVSLDKTSVVARQSMTIRVLATGNGEGESE